MVTNQPKKQYKKVKNKSKKQFRYFNNLTGNLDELLDSIVSRFKEYSGLENYWPSTLFLKAKVVKYARDSYFKQYWLNEYVDALGAELWCLKYTEEKKRTDNEKKANRFATDEQEKFLKVFK